MGWLIELSLPIPFFFSTLVLSSLPTPLIPTTPSMVWPPVPSFFTSSSNSPPKDHPSIMNFPSLFAMKICSG